MSNDDLRDGTPEERAFHRIFASVTPPPRFPVRAPTARERDSRHRRVLRATLAVATAVAVAGVTFAVFRGAGLIHPGGSQMERPGGSVTSPSSSPLASPSPSPSGLTGCRVPAVETLMGPGNESGYVGCASGRFTADPRASNPRTGFSVYLSGLGWTDIPSYSMPVLSPDGSSAAYVQPTQGIDGPIHVVSKAGDVQITPAGSLYHMIGWTNEGIVAAQVNCCYVLGDAYLINPTSGSATSLGVPLVNTNWGPGWAEGDALWTVAGQSSLNRCDLLTGQSVTWQLPAAPSGASPSYDGVTSTPLPPWILGFDSSGDPVVLTTYGQLYLLTAPGQATLMTTLSSDEIFLSDADDVMAVPGGILAIATVGATNTTFAWDPDRGWREVADLGEEPELGAASFVGAVIPS
jgi:hypothetical protein